MAIPPHIHSHTPSLPTQLSSHCRSVKACSRVNVFMTVVAPEPALIGRPRLYERVPASMTAPLGELFAATDIDFRAGWVDTFDAGKGVISLKGVDGAAEIDRKSTRLNSSH